MKIIIDGIETEISSEATILEKCNELGIYVPSLCYHPDLGSQKVCGMCIVEINGEIKRSCETKAKEGMVVKTSNPKIIEERTAILEKMMETHPNDCLICEKSKGDCELQNACYEYQVENKHKELRHYYDIDLSSDGMIRDLNKCIVCEKCVAVCRDVQGIGVYEVIEKNGKKEIGIVNGTCLSDSDCITCGQCIKVCPVGALTEKSTAVKLNKLLKRREKHFIVQMAPAIKHTIGEEFFIKPGEDATSKMVVALKKLGFEKVFSTDFSADVTIMEEGTELIQRLTGKSHGHGKLPMFTSCCPGWINYVEKNYPEFLDNLSSCKSPQQMFGALAKSYYSDTMKIPKDDICVVAIMPCTAKKDEANREELIEHGIADVDIVLTTREFAKLIRMNKIDFTSLEDGHEYDDFMGKGTGAARIFASSGGVMEAALRTVQSVLTGDELGRLDFTELRGFKNVKETEVEINGLKVKLAVINGIGSAKEVLDAIKAGKVHYDFIEVMACYGGCISGGGAPIPDNMAIRQKRMEGIYSFDKETELRKSHTNPEVKALYDDYLKEPCGHDSHHILHTTYRDRSRKK